MKRSAIAISLAVIIAGCGDDGGGATVPATAGTQASTSAAPATTSADTTPTEPVATTTETAAIFAGPTDCLEIWPEAAVQAATGAGFTFFEANPDRSACVYTALSDFVALAWRVSDLAGYEQSRLGAGSTGNEVREVAVCDTGFVTELPGAGILMEAFQESQARAYNVTLTGLDLDLERAEQWGIDLLETACS